MKKIFKYLFFLLPVFLMFGGGIFIQSYYAAFLFDIQSVEVELSPEESHVSTFNISFDETYTPYTEGEATYSISPITLCNLEDEETGDCVDEVPNLCPYLSLSSTDGETTETGFEKNIHNFNAYGELNKPVDETDAWQLSISAPCFEGECPSDYDEDLHGAPLPQSMKGKTFECNLYLSPNEPPPQVRNIVNPKIALADNGGNTIHVTAKLGGAVPTHDPVILIPGITGSYLIKDYDDEEEIWPNVAKLVTSFADEFLNDLAFNSNGTENTLYPIKVGDIVREEAGADVFGGLIHELETQGYVEDTDLFVFPYDWRKSNSDNAILLNEKINQILDSSGGEKVDLVAHSMGGIIAKKYIANEGKNKIDQLVFLGTPHLGAVKAFKALMYGDDMGFSTFFNLIPVLSQQRMKTISQNMPAVYELLPSQKYFEKTGGYFKDASISLPNYDYTETKNLMIQKGRNAILFPSAESLHASIDELDLSGLEVSNFVGCGTKTVGEIVIKQKLDWISAGFYFVEDYDLKYVNGDQTVPLHSADETPGANFYYAKKVTHGALPSADGVRQDIVAILTGVEIPNSQNILNNTDDCKVSGKNVSTHSPVELHIYDEEGNHSGPNSIGDIENEIPEVQYDIVGEAKFAFLPDGKNYRIVTKATDTGGYDLQIKAQDVNDNITDEDTWNMIPLPTVEATGEVIIGSSPNYLVKMDNDGNGIPDTTFSSNQPMGAKFYLNILREMVKTLDLKPKVKKEILEKISKVEKKISKNKEDKVVEKLVKFLQKLNTKKGKVKNMHEHEDEKDDIIDTINSLLDGLK